MDLEEPILKKNIGRYIVFPEYFDLWEMYKKSFASIWSAEEVGLGRDKVDWLKLTTDEQNLIKNVLAFFVSSDGIVSENLAQRFLIEVQISEARCFYGIQIAMENVHSEMYSLLLATYIDDKDELNLLFNAINKISYIKKKSDWAMKWISSNTDFGTRLVAFAAVEGIFFSGSFAAIFWLKSRGILPGLIQSNELISRDEGLHCEFACILLTHIKNKPSREQITDIIKDAVLIEKEFLFEIFKIKFSGLNYNLMCQYIEYVADRLLSQLKCTKFYGSKNPLDFMEQISLDGKTNFFEKRDSNYQKYNVLSNENERCLNFNVEF